MFHTHSAHKFWTQLGDAARLLMEIEGTLAVAQAEWAHEKARHAIAGTLLTHLSQMYGAAQNVLETKIDGGPWLPALGEPDI